LLELTDEGVDLHKDGVDGCPISRDGTKTKVVKKLVDDDGFDVGLVGPLDHIKKDAFFEIGVLGSKFGAMDPG